MVEESVPRIGKLVCCVVMYKVCMLFQLSRNWQLYGLHEGFYIYSMLIIECATWEQLCVYFINIMC